MIPYRTSTILSECWRQHVRNISDNFEKGGIPPFWSHDFGWYRTLNSTERSRRFLGLGTRLWYLKRKCCTALKKTSDRTTRYYCSCESDQPCRLPPTLVVVLHPAAIHSVGIAEQMQENNLFWNVQTHDLDLNVLCTCVYSTHQGKVCLDWRHKRGRRSQPPTPTF